VPLPTIRAALLALVLVAPAHAVPAPASDIGAYALPNGQAKVSATLALVAMTPLGGSQPVTRHNVELSKRLHLIAVSGDLRTFVHEHGDKPDARGHFRIAMTLPHSGLWHVYADAMPAGLGQ